MKRIIVGLFIGLFLCSGLTYAGNFTSLGFLDGFDTFSNATSISADGSVIAGYGKSEDGGVAESFRWTQGEGFQGLGDLPGGSWHGGSYSTARGISADGSTIVGRGISSTSTYFEGFTWNASEGMQGVGDLPGWTNYSVAEAASSDGSIVVGRGSVYEGGAGYNAFRWTEAEGMVSLGDLPGGGSYSNISSGVYSHAYDITPDGSTIVGYGLSASGLEAFKWTESTGMVGIGDLDGGGFESRAISATPDSSVIIGTGTSQFGTEAFRWTEDGGMIGLGDLEGGSYESWASAVSADGETVVGFSESSIGREAFIWDDSAGIQNLKDVLETDYGLDLSGWMLTSANGISDDGSTIVGYGINPYGNTEAWIATTEPVPEPTTIFLLGSGLVGFAGLRRKSKKS